MTTCCEGWAIDTRSTDGNRCIGRFWGDHDGHIPSTLGGYRSAVWNTRAEARAVLRKIKSAHDIAFPRARVAKVKVIVTTNVRGDFQ